MRPVLIIASLIAAIASLTSAIGLSLSDSLTEIAIMSVHYSNGETTITQKTLWESDKGEVFLNLAFVSILPVAGVLTLWLTLMKGSVDYRYVPVGVGAFGLLISAIFFLSASRALIVPSALMFLAGLIGLVVPTKTVASSRDEVGNAGSP